MLGVKLLAYDDEVSRLSRKLAHEFKETFGSLEEKSHRISNSEAEALAKAVKCPIEVARVACQIELDGVMDRYRAAKILMYEYNRRKKIDREIPAVPTYEFSFAVSEGEWLEYLWKILPEKLSDTARELFNILQRIQELEEIETWMIIKIMDIRYKIANTLIKPTIESWLKDHPDTTVQDAIKMFTAGLTDSEIDFALERFEEKRKILLDKFRIFERKLEQNEMTPLIKRHYETIKKLVKSLEEATLEDLDTVAQVFVELIPPPKQIIESSDYVIVHVPIPRDGMVGPDLVTPYDFLERDLKLALRRTRHEKEKLINETSEKVLRVIMIEEGKTPEDATISIINELIKRFNIKGVNLEEIDSEVRDKVTDRTTATEYIISFINKHIVKNKDVEGGT